MEHFCRNCEFCKCTTVKEIRDGKPVYYRNGNGDVVSKVRCKKGRWVALGKNKVPREKMRSMLSTELFKLPYCIDYVSMGETGRVE